MKRTVFISTTLIILGSAAGFAQSNDLIDALLDRETADFGSSLQLILSAGGLVDEEATSEEAYETFRSLGWRMRTKDLSDPLTAGELSYLIMKSLRLRGGIMYSILPSPRYAFRELVYRGVIPPQTPPGRIVSGEQVVRYLGAVLRSAGARS